MKETSSMRLVLTLTFVFCSVLSLAQLVQTPIVHKSRPHKQNPTARAQGLTAMQLPFWDDFSFNVPPAMDTVIAFPNDSLWQYGHSVWVNTGMGINPPTMKVATFDGIDSTALPYSINLPLAKGIADRLVSRPLRMDLVDPALQDSVFIFFYYQYEGNGEPPDQGDEFSLWFKNDSSTWDKVWAVQVDSTSDKTKFIPVKLYIKDTIYFHNNFQFRFQNFARLSGPFDTWNLDYVYVSNGKSQYAPNYADFPDRAIAAPLTSAFDQYQSIPVRHFLSKGDSLFTYPSISVTNQRKDQTLKANYAQPVNLVTHLTQVTRLNKVVKDSTFLLDSLSAQAVYYDSKTVFTLNKKPTFANLNPKVDSIALKFHIKLNTGDNVKKVSVNVGDYDTIAYNGIEFRYNDTTSTNFILRNYYAYDDGVAEYAVTLTQPGSYLAYQFDMMYSHPDTLIAVDIYFPHVGDESNQVVQLQILDNQPLDSTNANPTVLQQQDLIVQRTENNIFVRVLLEQAVLVSKRFYVGYKQNSFATIGVGFDKNSSSGSKIFYNTAGVWEQNTTLNGNMMIRPVFGKGLVQVPTAVKDESAFIYPNPNNGTFYFPEPVQGVKVVDVAGRAIPFLQEDFFEQTKITLLQTSTGLYLVRYFKDNQWRTMKIMVLQ